MSSLGRRCKGEAALGLGGLEDCAAGPGLICSWGLNSRFLKIPGKTIQDKGSCLEQLESQEQDRMDFKEEMLEVSP